MEWIDVNDRLPPAGKYVLVRLNRDNWVDDTDQENVNCKVAKLVKGISREERFLMAKGEMPSPDPEPYWNHCQGWRFIPRHEVTMACDEDGNNLRPYNWTTFGPASYFGQEVIAWCEIPL